MQQPNDGHEGQLIDLGAVIEETKGAQTGNQSDMLGGQRQFSGLTDED